MKAEFLIGSARKYYTDKERPALTAEQLASVPPVEHPVVRTHPETGRKALYVNPAHTVRILGIDDDEAEDLLADLTEHSVKPEFVYRHEWRLHDLVFWDNRCCMHIAEPPPEGSSRHMHRTTVIWATGRTEHVMEYVSVVFQDIVDGGNQARRILFRADRDTQIRRCAAC